MSDRPGAGDWMRLHIGDLVHCYDDPRHVGRVQAIFNGATARVCWKDTGWISDLPIGDLVNLTRYRSRNSEP